MSFNEEQGSEWEVSSRLWRFANFEFDESSRELSAEGGAPVEVESKPLDVLHQLLLHAGEVVTKEELLEAVWPGVSVVEGSLATAVSKLRKALGDDNQPVVLTVPRVGYRLAVPVQCRVVSARREHEIGFQPGDPVPRRDQWRFVRRLGASPSGEVWLAEHPKTHETRVFKYAADGIALKALKREVTLARLLQESLGERPEFVRMLEWSFDAPPFYVESEYCGPNLAEWAEAQGGLAAIPLNARLRVMADLAKGVAAAHDVGVLHKDLKPANVLMEPGANGGFQVKAADFGSGALLEPARLSALGITNLGFTRTLTPDTSELTGTLMYIPPEVLAGQSPTASGDVYALGVMLYQALAGDFRKPMAPGWEADIADPVLREDIALAACGDPSRRLTSAAALADRLQTLEGRRAEREELESARARASVAERRLAASRARLPWAVAAGVILAGGLAASLFLYRQATLERDRANHETGIADAVNRFLAEDLLAHSDPFQSGKSEETLLAAVKRASAQIDRQFRHAPEVAGRLHQAIAKAFDNRSDFPDARGEYERAAALFEQAQGPLSQDAMVVRLQRATMEARSYEKDSLKVARSLLAGEEARAGNLSRPRDDLPVWLDSARGMVALIDNDAKGAAREFQAAYDAAARLPSFDERALLTLKQKLAFAHIRLGDGATAERLFRELIAGLSSLGGPNDPNVLRVRLNLAQAYMVQGKNREAVDETTRLYPEYVARLGETHELTMQVLTTRAQCEGSLGLWDDAIRDDLAIYRIAVEKQGPASFFAVATLSDAALSQCRAGRYREGEPNARRAFEASGKAFGPHAGLTGGTAYALAFCDLGLGQVDEAARLLRDINPKPVAQLTGFPDWSANVSLAQADIAYRRGDLETARTKLETARPAFSKPEAEPYQKQALAALGELLQKAESRGRK